MRRSEGCREGTGTPAEPRRGSLPLSHAPVAPPRRARAPPSRGPCPGLKGGAHACCCLLHHSSRRARRTRAPRPAPSPVNSSPWRLRGHRQGGTTIWGLVLSLRAPEEAAASCGIGDNMMSSGSLKRCWFGLQRRAGHQSRSTTTLPPTGRTCAMATQGCCFAVVCLAMLQMDASSQVAMSPSVTWAGHCDQWIGTRLLPIGLTMCSPMTTPSSRRDLGTPELLPLGDDQCWGKLLRGPGLFMRGWSF